MIKSLLVVQSPDPVVQELCSIVDSRSVVGVEKYGTTLEDNKGFDPLEYALEEALDLSLYLLTEIRRRREQAIRASQDEGLSI